MATVVQQLAVVMFILCDKNKNEEERTVEEKMVGETPSTWFVCSLAKTRGKILSFAVQSNVGLGDMGQK